MILYCAYYPVYTAPLKCLCDDAETYYKTKRFCNINGSGRPSATYFHSNLLGVFACPHISGIIGEVCLPASLPPDRNRKTYPTHHVVDHRERYSLSCVAGETRNHFIYIYIVPSMVFLSRNDKNVVSGRMEADAAHLNLNIKID